MKNLLLKLNLSLLLLCIVLVSKGQLIIDTPAQSISEVQTLVENVLLGKGVKISNINYIGAIGSVSSFQTGNVATNMGIKKGLILSTGNVNDAIGPNQSTDKTSEYKTSGDADLNKLSNCSSCTQDAAVLSFDFIPSNDTLKFRYVFASEEYPEYVCSNFNDIFGFFVTGPKPGGGNYSKTNLALVPNTALPVAIKTINPGTPGINPLTGVPYSKSGCTSLAYSSLYVDNTNGISIEYDGFTTTLTAWALVVPCQTYTIKIGVADVADAQFDSSVFLEANSFSSTGLEVVTSFSIPQIDTMAVEGCNNAKILFKIPETLEEAYTLKYDIGGSAVNGIDYETIPGSVTFAAGIDTASIYIIPLADGQVEGNENVELTFTNVCGYNEKAKVLIYDYNPDIKIGFTEAKICKGETATITATTAGGLAPYTYEWDNEAGINNYIQVTPDQTTTYTLSVTDVCGAKAIDNTTVLVSDPPKAEINPEGVTEIPFGGEILITAYFDPAYSYQWFKNGVAIDGETGSSYSAKQAGTYTFEVKISDNCKATSKEAIVKMKEEELKAEIIVSTDKLCKGTTATLEVKATGGSGSYTFKWNTGDLIAKITVNPQQTTTYTVTVDDGNNYINVEYTITVNPLPEALITTEGKTVLCQGENTVLTTNLIQGYNYQWQKDNTDIKDATTNNYTTTDAGAYTIVVTDLNKCSNKSADINIVVNPLPQAVITADGPVSFCTGSFVVLYANTGNDMKYQWYMSNGVKIEGGTGSHYNSNSSSDYTVVITDNNNCINTSNIITVTVNPLPEIDLGNDQYLSQNQTLTLDAGAGFKTYKWNDNSTGQTLFIDGSKLSIGEYEYSISVTNNNDCSASDKIKIFITEILPCNKVEAMTSSNITHNSAELSFNYNYPGSNLSFFLIRYAELGTKNYYYRKVNKDEKKIVLYPLKSNTTYYWQVKTVCGEKANNSGYTAAVNFTTLDGTCYPAFELTHSLVNTNTVHLNWNKSTNGTIYKIRYAIAGTKDYKYRRTDKDSFNLLWLKANTVYYWQIKTICGTLGKYSDYAETDTFKTAPKGPKLMSSVSSPLNINIYPNPSSANITVSIINVTNPVSIIITDIRGQLIYNDIINKDLIKNIDLTGLSKGIYLLKAFSDENSIVEKIILQ